MTIRRNMSVMSFGVFLIGGLAAVAGEPAKKPSAPTGTHEQSRVINVKGESGLGSLQTLALSADGNVLALVSANRYGNASGSKGSSEVQVFEANGTKVNSWKLSFVGQSINGGPDRTIYVAGDGRLATFDKSGKPTAEIELPHIAKVLADQENLKKRAEEQRKSEIASIEEMVKRFKTQKEELDKKDADKLTPEEKAQLKQAEMMTKTYGQMLEQQKKRTVASVVDSIVSRVKIINGVAATDKDVYVVCGEDKGWGYAVWRMDRDLTNPKMILAKLGGCCGQMDIQASGDDLWVAENTKHAVGHYNREGKKLGAFGKRGKEDEADCFGGCCNPMNVRVGPQGRIYTAESEGFVRCFEPDGKPLGLVGAATLKGGCKNVAVAVSADGNTIFFCDQPGSRIIVLAKKKIETNSGGN